MKASIIIPAYKPAKLLQECLQGIIQNTIMSDVEVIVVCNGSDKESLDVVVNLGNPFILVWYNDAIGFTKAANAGIRLAKSEFIILLNTDAVILNFYEQNTWLNRLIDPLHQPKVGITGLGTMWTEYGPYLPFYCAGIKKKLFDELGMLDERFSPGYGEDVDFCYRVNAAGYDLVQVDNFSVDKDDPTRTVTDFPIWHAGEQSFTDKQKRLEYIDKNYRLLAELYKK